MEQSKNKLGQESAFATSAFGDGEGVYNIGMSKRFYAACAAMQGLLSKQGLGNFNKELAQNNAEILVGYAYIAADELLKQENE